MRNVKCKACGWIHFAVSARFIASANADWAKYVATLTKTQLKDYYGGNSAPYDYTKCFRCGGSYKNFRNLWKRDKFPNGSTIQPVKDFKE